MHALHITKLYWERIHLKLFVPGAKEDIAFIMHSGRRSFPVPAEPQGDGMLLTLNMMNMGDEEPVPTGCWYIQAVGRGKLGVADGVTEEFESLSRVYPYAKFRYAYTVSFHVRERDETFFIDAAAMMRNKKPCKHRPKFETPGRRRYLRRLRRDAIRGLMRGAYFVLSRLAPRTGKRILIASEADRKMSGNLAALDQRLRERGLDRQYDISYSFRDTVSGSQSTMSWMRFIAKLARQDILFIDTNAPFLRWLKLYEKTLLVQIWHRGDSFRSMAYSRMGRPGALHIYNSSHRQYDFSIVGSQALVKKYAERFGLNEERVLPLGLPRLDGMLDPARVERLRAAFFAAHPALRDKKLLLFAPTFRGPNRKHAHYDYDMLDLDALYDFCGEKYAVLFKMHPFIQEPVPIQPEQGDRFLDLSDADMDICDLFPCADILITDYSSITYEFSVTGKPMLFYMCDEAEYCARRGTDGMPSEMAPGKVVHTFAELLTAIASEDFAQEKATAYAKENFDARPEGAADRVIDEMILQAEEKRQLSRELRERRALHIRAKRKRFRKLKKFLMFKIACPIVFHWNRLRPVNGNKLVFVSDRTECFRDNLAALHDALQGQGFEIVDYLKENPKEGGRKKRRFLLDFMADYATAGCVLLEDYFLPAYVCKPRKKTRLVQVWHACGAFKKWGWSTVGTSWGVSEKEAKRYSIHRTYTDATVSSADVAEKYLDAYHCRPEAIKPYGVPRTDVFFQPEFHQQARDKFYSLYPMFKGKKVVLYAPTYRGNSIVGSYNEETMNFALLKEKLGEEYGIALKLHPLVRHGMYVDEEAYGGFVADVSEEMRIDEMLCVADICISDYSSLIFEFALMDRPMIFYAYDLEGYVDSRDFYYDYETMVPGPIVRNSAELAGAVLRAEEEYDPERMARFREKFMSACDGHSTERIIEKWMKWGEPRIDMKKRKS